MYSVGKVCWTMVPWSKGGAIFHLAPRPISLEVSATIGALTPNLHGARFALSQNGCRKRKLDAWDTTRRKSITYMNKYAKKKDNIYTYININIYIYIYIYIFLVSVPNCQADVLVKPPWEGKLVNKSIVGTCKQNALLGM